MQASALVLVGPPEQLRAALTAHPDPATLDAIVQQAAAPVLCDKGGEVGEERPARS